VAVTVSGSRSKADVSKAESLVSSAGELVDWFFIYLPTLWGYNVRSITANAR
jgi:hypothetical protein